MEKQNKAVAGSGNAPSITYDYANQAWIENGRYVRCGHLDATNCDCYGKRHDGELALPSASIH